MSKKSPLSQLARYSSVIFLLPSALLIGYWVGERLDRWLETEPAFTVIFILLGAVAGFVQVFRILDRPS